MNGLHTLTTAKGPPVSIGGMFAVQRALVTCAMMSMLGIGFSGYPCEVGLYERKPTNRKASFVLVGVEILFWHMPTCVGVLLLWPLPFVFVVSPFQQLGGYSRL